MDFYDDIIVQDQVYFNILSWFKTVDFITKICKLDNEKDLELFSST